MHKIVSELLSHTLGFFEFSMSLVRPHILILKCTNDMPQNFFSVHFGNKWYHQEEICSHLFSVTKLC